MELLVVQPHAMFLCSTEAGWKSTVPGKPSDVLPTIDALRPAGVLFLGAITPNPIECLSELRLRGKHEGVRAAIVHSEAEISSPQNEMNWDLKDSVRRFRGLFKEDKVRPERSERKLYVDLPARQLAVRGGETFNLSPIELRLLVFFLRYPGVTFSRQELLHRTRANSRTVRPQIIDVMVRRIRTKIEATPHAPDLLRTVHGLGYRLTESEDALFFDRLTGRRFVSWPCFAATS